MSYSDSGNAWRNDGGAQPHAYDPYLHPELFRGVATRRVFAFLIDMVVISVPVILGYLFIAVFGVVTLGIGWTLFWLAWPAWVSATPCRSGSPTPRSCSAWCSSRMCGRSPSSWPTT